MIVYLVHVPLHIQYILSDWLLSNFCILLRSIAQQYRFRLQIAFNNLNKQISYIKIQMLQFLGTGVTRLRYITYFIAYIAYGMYKIALGPLVPYLAEEAHKVETEYSFLFVCRAVGMLAGAALFHKYQVWSSRPSYHKMLAYSIAVIISTNFFFLWSNTPFFQGFWNFVLSIHYFFLELLIDLGIVSLKKNVYELMLCITGCFGLGSLISPFIVRILGLNSYTFFAIIMSALIPVVLYLPSPETSITENKQQALQQTESLNAKTVNLLCGAYFMYVGLLIAKLAWGSSFAVMAYGLTKQQATIFPSLHAGCNTFMKFLWIFIPVKGSNRLKLTTWLLLVASVISMVLAQINYGIQALVFDSITMGVFMAPVSSLILSVGAEFGRPVSESQTSKIMTWGVIGEGVLTMLYGNLIQRSFNIYFYFSIFVCLLMWYVSYSILSELEAGSKEGKKSQMEMHMIE